jgi:cbb3-type cytochrome oxidase cytochrome c subunit
MNQGPFIFLGLFFALAVSWFGLIVQPQLQIGRAQLTTNIVDSAQVYPQARPGLAQRGLQVYRSLGCASCHTQQMQQEGTVFDVILAGPGTNVAEVIKTVIAVRPDLTAPEASKLVERAPVPVLEHVADRSRAAAAADQLTAAGAKVETHIVPVGADIARGWGLARSVAADFLYDQPVMLGAQRIGPDLANVGLRLPDADWHYRHLYDPTSVVPKSVMPPYRFLFESAPARPGAAVESPKALVSDSALFAGSRTNWTQAGETGPNDGRAPEAGSRLVPTDDARALVAYLLSLKAHTPLLERPVTAPAAPAAVATATTSAAAAATEAPAL